ncbi:Aromatic prenyltransferase, DMATS type [Penicillium griseofulvum]|uniref:Aromatic prenyltransferase, DMATS type n=1 Tax=Penicillium patulum TaxID=5078 RepID=A0A135LJC3_PENPA|nr:Aromatic prenyltransferase, DMATS type [Penicillium griseofulvum]KXG49081.1 Aromatic prenyltransferase, DMATS type [Penicillium griseofulvum]
MTIETAQNQVPLGMMAKGASTSPMSTTFDVLSRYYLFTNSHQKVWWEKTGRLLDKILASAGYNPARRLEALTFYGQVLIPQLGPYPYVFHSAITRSGLPVEFSVNYQQNGNVDPVVRIGFEPVAAASGTEQDPYNQKPTFDLLNQLEKLEIPGFDPELFRYFLDVHTVNAHERGLLKEKKIEGSELTSQAAFGFDLKEKTISVKGYTFPAIKCNVNEKGFGNFIAESIQPLAAQMGPIPSFDMVHAYLEETNGYSQFAFWSFDCVDPAQSRLKLYSSHNSVVWSKVEEIWTLGGRAKSPVVQRGLEYLKELWQLTKLSEGHRDFNGGFDDGDKSTSSPMVWNYEMKKGEATPLTKFYFPIHGESDQNVISGLAEFLSRIGLSKYGDNYEATVQHYFPERDLSKTARLTSWISFAYTEKTGVYLSVYYHSSDEYPWLKLEETERSS